MLLPHNHSVFTGFSFFFFFFLKQPSPTTQWQPTPVFLPRESHGQRSLAGYSPWGRKESDKTKRLHFLSPTTHAMPLAFLETLQDPVQVTQISWEGTPTSCSLRLLMTQLLIALMGLKELHPSRARALAGAEGGGQAPLPTSRHCCCHCFLASPLHFQIPGVSWGSKPSPLLTFRMSSLGSLSFNSRPLPSPFCEPVTCDPISVLLQL